MNPVIDQSDLKRRLLFVPCETKEALGNWIRIYFDLYLPDCTVTEESNSNPLEMIWEVYNKLRLNNDPDFSRAMAYANRGGFKTLGASILEVLTVVHLGRNVAHMAAILDQSKKSQEYVRDFFAKPYLRDFRVGQNVKKIEICRYHNATNGRDLTEHEWATLDPKTKLTYKRVYNYIQIVLCTMQGANSAHTEFFVVDEVDVVPKQNVKAYNQAKSIPDSRDGMMPITLLTSTRKSRIGLVQKEIDKAEDTGLHIRHWNIIDTTAACMPDRHLPDQPKINLYINDDEVRHISEADYMLKDDVSKAKFYRQEAFAGCVRCPLFSSCKTRLATHQLSKSPMLKPITDVIAKFRHSSAEYVSTEYLCRKPDTTGLIYPRLNRETHMKTAAQMAEIIAGEPRPEVRDKATLIAFMKARGVTFNSGMDFGFTHNFAVCTFGVWGHYAFVLDVISQSGLELDDKLAKCEPLKEIYSNPTIFGDTAYPSDIKTFKRKGFKMKDWDKAKDSVKGGIEVVRMMLWPALSSPRLFFLKDDPGCTFLVSMMELYHFQMDAAGDVSEDPDKEKDDECDAIRYGIMNTFAPKGLLRVPATATPEPTIAKPGFRPQAGDQQDWMKEIIRQHTGESSGASAPSTQQVKKGRFVWDG